MKSTAHSRVSWTSRLYEDEQDLRCMLDLLIEGRNRTNDWHYAHVGELLFSFFMVQCHLEPRRHIRLWQHRAGKLVGYAILGEDPSFECQVLTDYEWRGIEEQAITWAENFVNALRIADPARWAGDFTSGARQDDLTRISFLEAHGFKYHGRFAEVNMLRSLSEPIPELEVPSGWRVCSMAELGNIADRAAAHCEVWQPWTVGNVTEAGYTRFMRLPGYLPDLDVVVLSPQGVIASYVNGWIDPLNKIGDFGPVGARQEYRQRGLTRLALLESLRRMKAYGMQRVCISTGVTNTPALNLYASVGFKIENKYLDYIKSAGQ
jgi:mycothiol synthase